MKITQLQIFHYKLPYTKPLLLGTSPSHYRDGFLVKLTDETGEAGIGEIAPFPGVHSESLSDIRDYFSAIADVCSSINLPDADRTEDDLITSPFGNIPSLLFGLDMALKQLTIINEKSLTIGKRANMIKLHAMLSGEPEKIMNEIVSKTEQGWDCFKIKIGRYSIAKELELLDSLDQLLPEPIRFRPDANRLITNETASNFYPRFPSHRIEYIEEPLKDIGKLHLFHSTFRLPIALDESLNVFSTQQLTTLPGLRSIIIKPEAMGLLSSTLKWITFARQYNLTTIFSNAFYSPLTIVFLAHYFGEYLNPDTAHGLNTFQYFKPANLFPPLLCTGPLAEIPDIKEYIEEVKWNSMELVYEWNR